MTLVGGIISSFLILHTDQPTPDAHTAALDVLANQLAWTRDLLAPLNEAYEYEGGGNSNQPDRFTFSPLCAMAQKFIAGDFGNQVDIADSLYTLVRRPEI